MHNTYCFAGQPAPCSGYFANDALPCVCASTESLLFALSQVAVPFLPVDWIIPPAAQILPLTA
jgi:hypothetical protein